MFLPVILLVNTGAMLILLEKGWEEADTGAQLKIKQHLDARVGLDL